MATAPALLPHLGFIDARGEDSLTFLQGQFCGDLLNHDTGASYFSGWCNPQGRVISTFLVVHLPDCIRLVLPETLREKVHKRLGMYVLRARVTLRGNAPDSGCRGLAGEGATEFLAAAGIPIPPAGSTHVQAGTSITALAGPRSARFLFCGPEQALPAPKDADTTGQAQTRWRLADIHAGLAWLAPATSEKFLPQELNLDELGGLSYGKGCYAGQEVIARVHYRGRLKHRLCRFTWHATETPAPGEALLRDGVKAGVVLEAQPASTGVQQGLAVVAVEALDAASLRLARQSDGDCLIDPLPRHPVS